MSEQIPQDPERQEGGGVEGTIEDLDAREGDADEAKGGASPQLDPKKSG